MTMTNSSDIGLTCDVCGRTVQGAIFVNGMKFCAKCYQETFGNNYSQTDVINAQCIEHLLKENAQLKEEIERLKKSLHLAVEDVLCESGLSITNKGYFDEFKRSLDYYITKGKEGVNET